MHSQPRLSSLGLTNVFLAVILVSTLPFRVDAVEGQSIGSMYQCAHDFRGEVFVKNDREIIIKGMNYDGKGPAAWFHGQLKGSKGIYTTDGNFTTLPYPRSSCDRLKPGRRYTDEDVTLILPRSIKDFETIGIFCYQYCHNFGHIVIPEDLTVPPAPLDLLLTQPCPVPQYARCSLEKGRKVEIRPNCPAGAPKLISGGGAATLLSTSLTLIAGVLITASLSFTRN